MLGHHFLNDNMEAKKGLRDSKDIEKNQDGIQGGIVHF